MVDRFAQVFDASVCAEIALVIFAAVFFAILLRALRTSRGVSGRQASLPLDDGTRRTRND